MKKSSNSKGGGGGGGGVVGVGNGNNNNEEIDWELRPGGMLVQKRDDDDDDDGGGVGSSGPMIKIRVSHGSSQHEINIPAQSTFGDLKKLLAHETGLEPKEQRLLFRGKEKEDVDCLHMVGVKDMSKVVLLEDPASKERKLEEMKMDDGVAKACEEVVKVRSEVDKLAEKVSALESAVHSGNKVAEKEFIVLTELLMVKLLKLDSIQADGEAKAQRRIEVRRVQGFVDTLDDLKARNSNPFSNSSGGGGSGSSNNNNNSNNSNNNNNSMSVTTKWESFEGGFGSLSAPQPQPIPTSPQSSKDWERFD